MACSRLTPGTHDRVFFNLATPLTGRKARKLQQISYDKVLQRFYSLTTDKGAILETGAAFRWFHGIDTWMVGLDSHRLTRIDTERIGGYFPS
jgi:hypothetical protein